MSASDAEADQDVIEALRAELADVADERDVLSARLGIWESRLTEHTPHDNCATSEPCYEWGFSNGWKAAMDAYKCWCGSLVGPRVPGDQRGVGCLADITHDWTGTRCPTCIHPEGYDRLSGPCPTCRGEGAIESFGPDGSDA